MIGYAFCGSFCTLKKSFAVFREMAECGEELLPIVSENVWSTDTRFQTAKDFCESLTAGARLYTRLWMPSRSDRVFAWIC